VFSAALPAFLASLVEFVEALTIVLAVGATRGWRSAGAGTVAAIVLLAALVALFGPALARVPLGALQIVVGLMLVLFGLRWLRKAVLRYAGAIPLHDEAGIYERTAAKLRAGSAAASRMDWGAAAAAFNAVAIEGLEVIFIVIAVGATAGALLAASLGATLAGVLVVALGFALRAPLARVPENGLKFAVGVMLAAFGTFWLGEGSGYAWPGADLSLGGLVAAYLAVSGIALAVARGRTRGRRAAGAR
jgi:uncharacterized membrane protein